MKPILSILIPTIFGREQLFRAHLEHLKEQAKGLPVSFHSLCDNKQMSIGSKRDMLYNMADGLYSVQLDDDDWEVDDYVQTVVSALEENPTCTHLGYEEKIEALGRDFKVKRSIWSYRFNDWETTALKYHRTPGCKTPILTKLCKQTGVKDMRFGEDHDFSRRIKPLLTEEVFIPRQMIIYRYKYEEHEKKYGIRTS